MRRPHVAKELMVSVRAKSYPPLNVNGVPVTAYQFLELSIFPGAHYTLLLQLSRDMTELFHAYFLTSHDGPKPLSSLASQGEAKGSEASEKSRLLFGTDHLAHAAAPRKSGTGTSLASVLQTFKSGGGQGGGGSGKAGGEGGGGEKAAAGSAGDKAHRPTSSRFNMGLGRGTQASEGKANSGSGSGRRGSITGGGGAGVGKGSVEPDPILYFKYVRFGDLNVVVSLSGFTLALDAYRASVPPYVRQGRVLTWRRLIKKLESHALHSVASAFWGRNSAPNPNPTPLLLQPLFGEGPGSGAFGSHHGRDDEDEEVAARSSLLFGTGAVKKK
jgi:hypothetical protein